MENLNVALSTIPFYERNNIDISLFSESDIQSMDQRATKFKQKYFNDKKYTTPELEAQEKILKNLTTSDNIVESGKNVEEDESKTMNLKDIYNESKDINLEHYEPVNIFCDKTVIDSKPNDVKEILDEKIIHPDSQKHVIPISKMQENVATIIQVTEEINVVSLKENCQDNIVDSDFDILQNDIADQEINKVKTETTFNKVNAVPKEIELPTGNN